MDNNSTQQQLATTDQDLNFTNELASARCALSITDQDLNPTNRVSLLPPSNEALDNNNSTGQQQLATTDQGLHFTNQLVQGARFPPLIKISILIPLTSARSVSSQIIMSCCTFARPKTIKMPGERVRPASLNLKHHSTHPTRTSHLLWNAPCAFSPTNCLWLFMPCSSSETIMMLTTLPCVFRHRIIVVGLNQLARRNLLTYLPGEGSLTQQSDEEVHLTRKNLRYHPYRDSGDEPRVVEGSKRNGGARDAGWKVAGRMAKTNGASSEAFISALAVAHPQSLCQDLNTWIEIIQPTPGHVLVDNSLPTVVQRCQDSGDSSIKCRFISILSRVQLTIWCQRQVSSLLFF